MMSALIEDSLLLKAWNKLGIKCKPYDPIMEQLGEQQAHADVNGSIEIFYLNDTKWSSNTHTRNEEYMSKIFEELPSIFDGEPYLLVKNNFTKSQPNDEQYKSISVKSHGCNDYRDYNNIAYLASTNPDTPLANALKECFGFTDDDFFNGFVLPNAYQSICRTSLRQPKVSAHRKIVVGSKAIAEALQRLFPQATIRKFDGLEKKDNRYVETPMTPADRKSKARVLRANKPLSPTLQRKATYLVDTYEQCQDLQQYITH